MSLAIRLLTGFYVLGLSLVLFAGSWPLQGPLAFQVTTSHGVHYGDLAVLAISGVVSLAVVLMGGCRRRTGP